MTQEEGRKTGGWNPDSWLRSSSWHDTAPSNINTALVRVLKFPQRQPVRFSASRGPVPCPYCSPPSQHKGSHSSHATHSNMLTPLSRLQATAVSTRQGCKWSGVPLHPHSLSLCSQGPLCLSIPRPLVMLAALLPE